MVIKSHTLILLVACLIAASSTVFLLATQHKEDDLTLSYQVYKAENGWGYNILAGKRIIIRQPFLPGVPGNAGFDREQDAAKVARIVIEKIKSGQIPSISHQQLQRLGVLHTQVK